MAFIDDYDFDLLKNEAENLVLRELERQLANYLAPICRCNDCIVDMAALALNSVKPLYRVSLLGTIYASNAMDERAYALSVRQSVLKAIEQIRKNPSHEVAAGEEAGN